MSSNLGRCQDCGASVIWSKTMAGRKIPLNPIPLTVALGNPTEEGEHVAVRPAYAIHFSTCAKRNPRIRR